MVCSATIVFVSIAHLDRDTKLCTFEYSETWMRHLSCICFHIHSVVVLEGYPSFSK
jgi:hypothetical protein